ncbi:hypothetical protein HOF67_04745 [Candidatus Peregrinibacteria bacterium]|jgi:hypothetical protein|nr:hypothetical protein [Candidatus Peregrinibacteria bacterium]
MKIIKLLIVTGITAIVMTTIVALTACTNNTITEEDIARGWYTAQEDEKKIDTPDNWIWIEDGENSKWIESVTEMMDY